MRSTLFVDDELFLLDDLNHRVQVFHAATGRFLRSWGQTHFRHPNAIAIRRKQREVVVVDSSRDEVSVWSLWDTQLIRYWNTEGRVRGLALTDGEIIVSEDRKGISIFSPNGDFLRQHALSVLDGNVKLALDLPYLYIWDRWLHEIFVINYFTGEREERKYGGKEVPKRRKQRTRLTQPKRKAPPIKPSLERVGGFIVHGDELIATENGTDPSHRRLVVFDIETAQAKRQFRGRIPGIKSLCPCDLAMHKDELFVIDDENCKVLVFV